MIHAQSDSRQAFTPPKLPSSRIPAKNFPPHESQTDEHVQLQRKPSSGQPTAPELRPGGPAILHEVRQASIWHPRKLLAKGVPSFPLDGPPQASLSITLNSIMQISVLA